MLTNVIPDLIGQWRLVTTRAHDEDGKPMRLPYGPEPMGTLIFFANGRMMASLCDGRAEIPEAELPREFVAYGGHYTFNGESLSTRVDFTSDLPRMGTDQVRGVKYSNGQLTLLPPPRLFEGRTQYRELVWERTR